MAGFNDALNGSILSPVLAFDPVAETFYCADKMIGFGFECQPLPGVRLEDLDKVGALLEEDWPNGAFLSVLMFASTNVVLRLGDCLRQREGSGRDDDVDFTHRSLAWFDERARRGFDEISGQRLRNWRLIITAKVPTGGAKPTEVELERIDHLKRRLSSALAGLDLHPRTLNAEAWLTVSAEMANQQDGASWQRYGVRRHEPSVPLNEQVIDAGSKIMIERDHLALHGNKKLMILTPTALPEQGYFGMASTYFSDLTRGRKGVTRPVWAVMNVWFGDQGGERSKMQSRAVMAKHTAGGSIVKWFPNIAEQAHCFAELQRSTDAGHAIVRCQLAFGVYADSEEDREPALSEVIGHFSQRGWTVAPDRFITAPLFITALPFGACGSFRPVSSRFKTMTSEHARTLVPLFASWPGTDNPLITGVARDGQFIAFDLYDSPGGYNGVIAARTGAGKSVFVQALVQAYLANGAAIWIIDKGNSYRNLAELLEGQYIDFEASGLSLNPFSHIDEFAEEEPGLVDLLGAMAASNEELNNRQAAGVQAAVRAEWDAHGRDGSIDGVADRLLEHEDQRVSDVGHQLASWRAEGPYGRFFAGTSNVSFDNRFVVLELGGLTQRPHLQRIVLLQLMSKINAAMARLPKTQRKIFVIDEAHDLLAEGRVGSFIEGAYRRFRKENGAALIATQRLADLYESPAGAAIVSNSPWKFLLQQEAEDIDLLVAENRLDLSPADVNRLKSVRSERGKYGEMMVLNGGGGDIMRILLDPTTRLLFSTHAPDVAAIQAARAQGLSLPEAVDAVLAARTPKAVAAE